MFSVSFRSCNMEKAAGIIKTEKRPNITMRLVNSKWPTVKSISGSAGITKCLISVIPIIAGTPKTMAVRQSTNPFLCCFKPPTRALTPTINREYAVATFSFT